jgi:carboxymethylenebutenolidase
MSFQTEWVRFGHGSRHTAYGAWPQRAAGPLPAIVVIQEAWGVDAHIEDLTLRFAKAGYVALAPDLFAENGQRPAHFARPRMDSFKEFMDTMPAAGWSDPKVRDEALGKVPEPRRSELAESFAALQTVMPQLDSFVPILVDAAEYLRTAHPVSRGARVGSVGYCMGGGLSARLACADPKLAAAVVYYGHAPPADRIASIACPVLGLYGALDARVNPGIADFAAAMKSHGKRFEHHMYDGAPHAFFNDTRSTYHAGASRDAFARTLDLFRREL